MGSGVFLHVRSRMISDSCSFLSNRFSRHLEATGPSSEGSPANSGLSGKDAMCTLRRSLFTINEANATQTFAYEEGA